MKRKIILVILVILCLQTLVGCDNKNIYIFPTEVLNMTGETPEQRAENINRERNLFPEADYGKVYVNNEGQLCYELTSRQKKNLYDKGKNGLEVTKMSFELDGKVFELSDDLKKLTITADEKVIARTDREALMNYYAGEVLSVQFFGDDSADLSLETTVVDEDNNILGVVEWPQTTGYFASAE